MNEENPRPDATLLKQFETALAEAIEKVKSNRDELNHLTKMEASAKEAILHVTDRDLRDPATHKIIDDSKTTLALVAERRRKLATPGGEAELVLKDLFRQVRASWDHAVIGARTKAFEDLIRVTLPFFNGDERLCRRHWDGLEFEVLPIAYLFRRARTYVGDPGHCGEGDRDLVGESRILLNWIKDRSSELGWS